MWLVNLYDTTTMALTDLWQGILDFVPSLFGALVIFLIGWYISAGIGKLIAEVLKRLKFNKIFEKGSLRTALEKADFKVDASEFVGAICKWILVIVFLSAAVEILGFTQFAIFLSGVIAYLPNVVVAILILVIAAVISDIFEKIVRAAIEGTGIGYAQLAGAIVKWSIWIFAIMAILYQLNIAAELIQTLFTGIVGLIVIAGGIAFGLGGKDAAADVIEYVRSHIKK
jgi:hypothetical protein